MQRGTWADTGWSDAVNTRDSACRYRTVRPVWPVGWSFARLPDPGRVHRCGVGCDRRGPRV